MFYLMFKDLYGLRLRLRLIKKGNKRWIKKKKI